MAVGFADKDSEYYLSRGYVQGETVLGRIFVPTEGVELTGKASVAAATGDTDASGGEDGEKSTNVAAGIDDIRVRYEKHPWIERFELDGIRAARPRRTGFGTKYPKLFVKNLNTIYAAAFDEYREFESAALASEQAAALASEHAAEQPQSQVRQDAAEHAAEQPQSQVRQDATEHAAQADGAASNQSADCTSTADTAFYIHVTEEFIRRGQDPNFRKMLKKFCGFTENLWREGNEASCNIALGEVIPRLLADDTANAALRETITDEFREYLEAREII